MRLSDLKNVREATLKMEDLQDRRQRMEKLGTAGAAITVMSSGQAVTLDLPNSEDRKDIFTAVDAVFARRIHDLRKYIAGLGVELDT